MYVRIDCMHICTRRIWMDLQTHLGALNLMFAASRFYWLPDDMIDLTASLQRLLCQSQDKIMDCKII